MMTGKPQPTKFNATTDLAARDEMSQGITRSIDDLSRDVTLPMRWRLKRVRGEEALKLSETALAEYMAAKRRTFVYQIGLIEDHTKKVMLSESMKNSALVEREIAQTINEAVKEFEAVIDDHEEAAIRKEFEAVKRAEAMLAAGQISERRCAQRIANVQASTDKTIETVQRTTREILANLERRFHAALQQG